MTYGYPTRPDPPGRVIPAGSPAPLVDQAIGGMPYGAGRLVREGVTDDEVSLHVGGYGIGQIDASQFAEGIEPVAIVDTLPNPVAYDGPVTVFLTTDQKLYRYDPGVPEFVRTHETTDLTGQIATTQITDGAVTTPKIFAGAVTADEIGANAVIAGKIDADAVTAGTIAAGAINAQALFVDGIITARKLVIRDYDNLVPSGDFIGGSIDDWWGTGTYALAVTAASTPDSANCPKAYALEITTQTTNADVEPEPIHTDKLAVSPGEIFYYEAWIVGDGLENADLRIGMIPTDRDGGNPTFTTRDVFTAGSYAVWTKVSGFLTIPAAKYLSNIWISVAGNGTPAGKWYITDIKYRRSSGVTIEDGAITAVKIGAGEVIAGKIAAGAINAGNIIVNGIIVTAHMTAGTINADRLTALSITAGLIGANQIVAGKIATNAVEAGNVAADAIQAGNIAANAVQAGEIAAGAINAGNIIVNGIIATSHMSAGTINANRLTAGSISVTEMGANSIDTSQLVADAVTAAKIDALAIQAGHIAAGAINATNIIASGMVITSHMTSGTINANRLTAGSISVTEMGALSVDTGELRAGAVTAAKIQTGTITATQITGSTLSAIYVNAGTITAGLLQCIGGTTFIDLSATGSQTFIKAGTDLVIEADGDATFGGTVSSDSFTASSAYFQGIIVRAFAGSGFTSIEGHPIGGIEMKLQTGTATQIRPGSNYGALKYSDAEKLRWNSGGVAVTGTLSSTGDVECDKVIICGTTVSSGTLQRWETSGDTDAMIAYFTSNRWILAPLPGGTADWDKEFYFNFGSTPKQWAFDSGVIVNAAQQGGSNHEGCLKIMNRSGDPSTPSSGIYLYSKSGELYVKDSSGNVYILSPPV